SGSSQRTELLASNSTALAPLAIALVLVIQPFAEPVIRLFRTPALPRRLIDHLKISSAIRVIAFEMPRLDRRSEMDDPRVLSRLRPSCFIERAFSSTRITIKVCSLVPANINRSPAAMQHNV